MVEQYLEAIKSSTLNSYVHVFGEEALQKARQLDADRKKRNPLRKLHGVVVGIKDVICYKDHPVTAASKMLQNFSSLFSATAVERLIAEDAIIIGTHNCDEFAMGSTNENSFYGPVKNPVDESRVPGGSSGGSAAAVKANLCMIALGSDTGGSVRQPADFCGVFGIKPTYGRISRHGLIAYASSFDQIGILAKSVDDAALVLQIISGADEFDSTVSHDDVPDYLKEINKPNEKKRIGYIKEALDHPSLDEEIKNNLNQYLETLTKQGFQLMPISFALIDYIVPTYYILTTAEASSNLSRYDGVRYGYRIEEKKTHLTDYYAAVRSAGFGSEVRRRIMLGTFVLSTGYYDAYYQRAQQLRRRILDHSQLVFNQVDFLILPTVPSPAFKIGEKLTDPLAVYLADIFTVYANLTGLPASSLPLFNHSIGVPYGLQLISNHQNEVSLLRISREWMQQSK